MILVSRPVTAVRFVVVEHLFLVSCGVWYLQCFLMFFDFGSGTTGEYDMLAG